MARDSNNLGLWNQVCTTDPAHTRKVSQRGGFTAIDAYYTIRRLTERFGPVGKGWGGSVAYQFHDGLVVCTAEFWHCDADGRHVAPAILTSNEMFATDKSGARRVDEDAGKKALTDAITKWASYLGFSADVFEGKFDDNRYVAAVTAEFRKAEKAEQESSRLWKSAADRKRFVEALMASFRAALTAEELAGHAGDNLEAMRAMKAGSETDRLSHAELQKVYAQELARLKQADADRAAYGPGFADTPTDDRGAA